jgi:predicted TIM-barrel fold metal-dependent hydrolase
MTICDAQVHAPDMENAPLVRGMNFEELTSEMDNAGVDRAVLVPLAEQVTAAPGIAMAGRAPDRFRVMARPDLTAPDQTMRSMQEWAEEPLVAGIRVSFFSGVNALLFDEGRLEWLFKSAQALDLPMMINVSGKAEALTPIAAKYPALRLAVDHLGLLPFKVFDRAELIESIEPLLPLAEFDNISVKATALPSSVKDDFPFLSLADPIKMAIDAFGPSRVFWGTDYTRLSCSYLQAKEFFVHIAEKEYKDELPLMMGDALCEWLRW